jgi:hypothetical protein
MGIRVRELHRQQCGGGVDRRQRWWWWRCRGNNCVAVAPATTMITAVVTWVSDFMQKRHDEICKCTSRHFAEFLFFDLSLSHQRLVEPCLITCYE